MCCARVRFWYFAVRWPVVMRTKSLPVQDIRMGAICCPILRRLGRESALRFGNQVQVTRRMDRGICSWIGQVRNAAVMR